MKVIELFEQVEDIDLDRAYELFSASYQEHTGTAWTKEKFISRSQSWDFYGDENGYVAVRPQHSGLVKLVGVGGSPRSVVKGMKQIMDKHLPVWGMMSSDLVPMAKKLGMIQPPAWIVKGMLKLIPSGVFGNVPITVNSDGSITLQYSDVGEATKYFVGSKEYFIHMLKSLKGGAVSGVNSMMIKPLLIAIERMIK
jgi:hypothetical protein